MDQNLIKRYLPGIASFIKSQGITGSEHRLVMSKVESWLEPLANKEELYIYDHIMEMAKHECGISYSPLNDARIMGGEIRDHIDAAPERSRAEVKRWALWGRRSER